MWSVYVVAGLCYMHIRMTLVGNWYQSYQTKVLHLDDYRTLHCWHWYSTKNPFEELRSLGPASLSNSEVWIIVCVFKMDLSERRRNWLSLHGFQIIKALDETVWLYTVNHWYIHLCVCRYWSKFSSLHTYGTHILKLILTYFLGYQPTVCIHDNV